MDYISLAQYMRLNNSTQDKVAEALGITQGGVSHMLKNKRLVFVRLNGAGEIVDAFENKNLFKNRGR